ncbi:restriction endonuclease subunit S [Bacteroides uniformis]|uniref:restriction endonuclease subunit S n=1 Tax=Bacteroides uniformis TaxID=820 RepID=UPI001B8B0FBE|nr:restriction endonuclease subunit S [Bacteroides uniformis]QUT69087.1 Type I restriction modification DNA specificity domain protein [Bacteroides uniformis]
MTTTINNEHKKLNVPNKREQNQTCLDSAEREGLRPKGNVPNLRFPEFQGEWEKCTFDKIAHYKKGPFGSALKKDIFVPQSEDTIKVYEQQNAIKKDWTLSRYYITKDYFNSHMKQFVAKAGDLIVSCAGTIGEIYELPQDAEEGVFNQALMRVQVNDEAVNKEIFITVFSSMIDKFSKIYSNGSAIKNIPPFADLKKTQVFLPCKEEQKKIAKLLALLDERIATQNKIIEDLKKLKSAISHILFSSKGAIHLSEIANVVMGQSPSSNAYNDQGLGMPLVQGNLDISNGKTTPRLYTAEFNQTTEKGNIILTVRAPVGEVAKATQKVCLGRGVCAIIPHEENMSDFIYQYLTFYKFMWRRYEQGSTFTSINGSDVRNIFCPKVRNVSILTLLDIKINIEERVVKQYQSQKQYMLYQMFI